MAEPRSRIGDGDIISGKNGTGSTIAEYLVVAPSTTVVDGIILPGSADAIVIGVTRESIADGAYGGIQQRGLAVCTAGAEIALGARVMPTTAGKVITWTAAGGANAAVVGIAKSYAAADTALVEVELAGPGVSRQG